MKDVRTSPGTTIRPSTGHSDDWPLPTGHDAESELDDWTPMDTL